MDDTLYLRFVVRDEHFAIPAQSVKEVVPTTRVTRIPGTPRSVAGYVNLRGQLYIVLDLVPLIMPHSPTNLAGSFIVFHEAVGETFAVRIDRLCDMVTIATNQISFPVRSNMTSAPISAGADHLVKGHARLADALVGLLDPHELCDLCFGQETATDERHKRVQKTPLN